VAEEARAPTRAVERAAASHRRHHPHRRFRWVLVGLCALLAVSAAVSAATVLGARKRFDSGRLFLEQARDRLLDLDFSGARVSFARAREEFTLASDATTGPLIGMWAVVPFVGRTYDAVRDIARIGQLTAGAGEDVTAAIVNLPGGASDLAPASGRIRLDAVASVNGVIVSAADRIRRAQDLANGLARTFVLPQISEARGLLLGPVEEAARLAGSAEAVIGALPTFAGADGPRRYFVAVQNPAELRGTGGFIGTYSVLTADAGALSFAPFRDITKLRDVPSDEIPSPSMDFARLYGEFGGAGYWRNINMSPAVPEVGEAIERLYELVTGVRLDGAIFVDPCALAELLRVTGPIQDPGLGLQVSAENAVQFMTNEAYRRFPRPVRKRILGGFAGRVLSRFLQGHYTDPAAAIRALVIAASTGHLALHAAEPKVERAFKAAGIDGSLSASWDYLGVFLNNAAGNKADYYLDEHLSYSIVLGDEGSASADFAVRLTNRAPAGLPPDEVLGPYESNGLEAGDTMWWVETLCARSCTLDSARQDGGPGSVQSLSLNGVPMFRSFARANAGDTTTLGYRFDLPHAWQGDEGGGIYRLTVQTQSTIRPVRARIQIKVPEGMGIVDTNGSVRVREGIAVWSGTVRGRLTLSVEFQRPFLERVWARLSAMQKTPFTSRW
jgi:hypothetical protein